MKKQSGDGEFWLSPEWVLWVLVAIMAVGVLGAFIAPMLA